MDKHSYLGQVDIGLIQQMYNLYQNDPDSVEPSWQRFFEGFEFARTIPSPTGITDELVDKEFKVIDLIDWYRKRGHLFTRTNPVRERRKYYPTLDIENYGLNEKDLDQVFQAGKLIGIGPSTLKKIVEHLNETYCQSVGAEFMFIRNPVILEWLQKKMESSQNREQFTPEQKMHIYEHLNLAVGFEKYIHKKFVGQKQFSLEGTDALIPALDWIIEKGSELGIREFVIGMAHRGRLNVLANILKKPYTDIFKEYKAADYEEGIALGDVKYHLGYDRIIKTDLGHDIRVELLPNPSHLETVGPLVEGLSRARIEKELGGIESLLAPIIIHGDAALAGQGVVYEILQMSQLPGYQTGGTIHLVLNNQVGFTTNYLEGRSSTYCTDVAKVVKSPVFHVNGDDVEALIYVVSLAMEFRQEFAQDVFIDILGYRRFGHNEGDEPRFTQPLLYKAIKNHPDIRQIYGGKLMTEGIITLQQRDTIVNEFDTSLDQCFDSIQVDDKATIKPFLHEDWIKFHHATEKDIFTPVNTTFPKKKLLELAGKINDLPEKLKFFQKVHRIVEARIQSIHEDHLDWAMAELLAYASLVDQGVPVRISGQDSERGTFAHRHAALIQEDTGEKYFPLKNISDKQAEFTIRNSILSEYGVLGFEYGYALAYPESLVVWEAQFGDFANNAQVIIDQYISSAEEKWGLQNGIVLYLPHSYEGQGPEHSSARIERFLTLAARFNITVVNPSNPANLFHLLRRQMIRLFRIPLVVFTPKSLLRHPDCVSTMDDLSDGSFQEIIDDPVTDPEQVKRIVFCWGKMYYDLLKPKKEWDTRDIALVRIEQMFPFPHERFRKVLQKYPHALLHIWCQEEPENMGAWRFIHNEVPYVSWIPVCRKASGSPASGLNRIHQITQQELVDKVFRKCTCALKNKYCGLQCVEGLSRMEILKEFEYL
ncbi:MAG: 2-oxoglutarate dehydrogenase E1 component [Porphyromonadaceae bacterium]|nr:MAG: 2-oxoglutarate dehydrogenase E1 component [Porphyromonadaceae bacterium]